MSNRKNSGIIIYVYICFVYIGYIVHMSHVTAQRSTISSTNHLGPANKCTPCVFPIGNARRQIVVSACDARPTRVGHRLGKHEEAVLATAVSSPRSTARSNNGSRAPQNFCKQIFVVEPSGHTTRPIWIFAVRMRGGQPPGTRQPRTIVKSQRVRMVR